MRYDYPGTERSLLANFGAPKIERWRKVWYRAHQNQCGRWFMARRSRRVVRREWTAQDERELKRHSKSKTPVTTISKALKRTPGALRQKARHLGITIGHRRHPKKSYRRRWSKVLG